MEKYIEATGRNEEAAIAAGLAQLGLERDDVSVEVLVRAKSGFLGIGSSPARVKLTYEVPDEPKPEPKPEPKAEQKPEPKAKSEPKAKPESKAKAKPAPAEKESAAKHEPAKAEPAPEKFAPEGAKSSENRSRKRGKGAPQPPREEKEKSSPVPAAAQPEEPADDEKAERIEAFLTGLLAHMESDARPVITRGEDGSFQVELVGSDLGALIGRRGETLDAIQQLTNYAVNRGSGKRVRIHLDAENYRAKREETLVRLARKTAAKALKYHRNMTLEPMNAYERHVIHTALQGYEGVTTYSTGSEPNRRVIVALEKKS